MANGAEPETASRLDTLTSEYDRLFQAIGDEEEERDIFLLAAKMGCSRPEKTAEYCERLLAAIDDGSATRAEERMAGKIQARLDQARQYIDSADLSTQEYNHLADRGEALGRPADKLDAIVRELNEMLLFVQPFIRAQQLDTSKAIIDPQHRVTEEDRKTRDRKSESVAAYFDDPGSYEENWNLVFDRINGEEMEIKVPISGRKIGYHVPGISKEDLEMLLNPILYKRSQARLQAIHDIRRFKENRQEVAASIGPDPVNLDEEAVFHPPAAFQPQAAILTNLKGSDLGIVDAGDIPPPAGVTREPQLPIATTALSQEPDAFMPSAAARGADRSSLPLDVRVVEPSPPDLPEASRIGPLPDEGRAPQPSGVEDGPGTGDSAALPPEQDPRKTPAPVGIDYDALGEDALRKYRDDHDQAVLAWMAELTAADGQDHLPVLRRYNQLELDITGAPDDFRKEVFATDPLVVKQMKLEDASRRNDLCLFISGGMKRIGRNAEDELQYDRKHYPVEMWRYLKDMFLHDPGVIASVDDFNRRWDAAVANERAAAAEQREPRIVPALQNHGERDAALEANRLHLASLNRARAGLNE